MKINLLDKLNNKSVRHPEKVWKKGSDIKRKPSWIRVKAPGNPVYQETMKVVEDHNLHTVCQEAGCPNIGSCWARKHAAFLIMGDICTRACAFCNIKTGIPKSLDIREPDRIARAVLKMGLQHVVITSPDRDDLADGGAEHFYQVISEIHRICPGTTVEVLTPDFLRKKNAVERVMDARPEVFNHNLETVPALYLKVRPGSRYYHSLRLLEKAKTLDNQVFTKSGIMLGLGEKRNEVMQVMDDMRAAGVDFLTIGQYLQPSRFHHPVVDFVTPDEFEAYRKLAVVKGFLMVSSSPLTRSSYFADEDFKRLKEARIKNSTTAR